MKPYMGNIGKLHSFLSLAFNGSQPLYP